MLKVMAVVRTLVLAFVAVYLLRELPLMLLMSSEAKQGTVTVGIDLLKGVASAAWLAVGWIGVETLLGWGRVWMAGRKAARGTLAAPPPAP